MLELSPTAPELYPPGRRAGLSSDKSRSCTNGAPSFMAESASNTGTNISYSTSINSRACSAKAGLVAATAAIACPRYRAFSLAKTFLL